MRKFRFRFETVLRHRAIVEDLRLRAFAAVQQEIADCEARLTACRAEREHVLRTRPVTMDLDDIARRERFLDFLGTRLDAMEQDREKIAARLEHAREALVSARAAREAIARLRQKDFEAYAHQNTLLEQNYLDEMATLRHGRHHEH